MKNINDLLVIKKSRTIVFLSLAVITAVLGIYLRKCLGVNDWETWLIISVLLVANVPAHINAEGKMLDAVQILFFALTAVFMVVVYQLGIGAGIGVIGVKNFLLNTMCFAVVFLVIFSITGHLRISVGIGSLLFLLFMTVDYFVILFRAREITPFDFLSIGTAMNVVGEFKFSVGISLIAAWVQFVLIIAIWSKLPKVKGASLLLRLGSFVLAIAIAFGVRIGSAGCEVHSFGLSGAGKNGSVLNFVLGLNQLHIDTPSDYSSERVSALENKYKAIPQDEHNPDVIVIMNESFADLSVLGNELNTNIPVTPFIDSLKENTIKGYALSSVFGGDTANSEYEFLTSNSMAFLPTRSVPYQQYINNYAHSVVSNLKQKGYKCVSMHPYYANGWMRTTVYPYFGFDESLFLDDFPQKNIVREYVSDMEMFNTLIDKYESMTANGDRAFIFGVSMQNHGGYTYEGSNFSNAVTLSGYSKDYPDAEQYLSILHKTDSAVEKLVDYYKNSDREVVIVFFGDHLPGLQNEFFEEIHGGPFTTLDEQMLKYSVPFFVWANYDIDEAYVERTSINYLANYMYKAAGMALPPYNAFLADAMSVVPVLNSFGYYSVSDGSFKHISDSQGQEAEILKEYELLQYNCIFDTENRSGLFFQTVK